MARDNWLESIWARVVIWQWLTRHLDSLAAMAFQATNSDRARAATAKLLAIFRSRTGYCPDLGQSFRGDRRCSGAATPSR